MQKVFGAAAVQEGYDSYFIPSLFVFAGGYRDNKI
jgi:hypothetical protein